MRITLDTATEQLLQRELERGRFSDANDLIAHALSLVAAEEDWLVRNREAIRADIEVAALEDERGEGYSPEEVAQYLRDRRAA